MRERGLKQPDRAGMTGDVRSLPMRERGLKHNASTMVEPSLKSLPMRERGLKQGILGYMAGTMPVAPHAGAWIETRT